MLSTSCCCPDNAAHAAACAPKGSAFGLGQPDDFVAGASCSEDTLSCACRLLRHQAFAFLKAKSRSWSRSRRAKYDQYGQRIKIFPILQIQFNLVMIETPMAGKSASLTFRLGFARLSRSQCQKCSQRLLRPPPHHPPFLLGVPPADYLVECCHCENIANYQYQCC